MKVGGQSLWNVKPICETSQIYYLMGRRPMKDVLGNHLKDRLFHFPVQRRARLLGSCVGVSSWLAAKAFALSLLEARSCVSSDFCVPLTGEVISDARYVPVGEWAACSWSPHSVKKKKVLCCVVFVSRASPPRMVCHRRSHRLGASFEGTRPPSEKWSQSMEAQAAVPPQQHGVPISRTNVHPQRKTSGLRLFTDPVARVHWPRSESASWRKHWQQ